MTNSASLKPVAQPAAGYNDLKFYFSNLNTMFSVRNMLAVDMMTLMSPKGLQRRLHDISAITKRIYAETTTPTVTNLLDQVEAAEQNNPDDWSDWDKANLKEMRRIHSHFSAVPPDVYLASVRTINEGRKLHAAALQRGSWKEAQPYIQQTVDLYRKIAAFKQKEFNAASPYRALLLGYASDVQTRQMDDIYDALLPKLSQLHKQARENNADEPISGLILRDDNNKRAILSFCQRLLSTMGFDFERGRLLTSDLTPMTAGNPDDVRVLIRCQSGMNFMDSVSDTLYQGARALYYQNLPQDWATQPVGQDMGVMMLNTTSILYKNIIGYSQEFFDYIAQDTDLFQKVEVNEGQKPANLYHSTGHIHVSAVRDKCDDFTKIIHDIMRYRIERDILNENLDVADIPARWDADCKELLGIEPSNDQEGALQNPDWFTGRFGFIPTNIISQIMAASFYQKAKDDGANTEDIAKGDMRSVGQWLNKNVHSLGHSKGPFEAAENILGGELSIDPLIGYLQHRYVYK